MPSLSTASRRVVLGTALVTAVVVPLPVASQSELDASEAEAFMGEWVVSMETDFGPFSMDLEIEDREGKVAATIGSPEMGGSQEVTDIVRSEESLVLTFEADAQGQFFEVAVTLEPDGDDLSVWFEVGGGEFAAGGVATRAGG